MSSDLSIHQTITLTLDESEGGGWEFYCPSCGYRARYTHGSSGDENRLDVLSIGDPQARHVSDPTQVGPRQDAAAPGTSEDEDISGAEDDVQLPPDLEQQLEEILSQFDLDDWGLA